MLSKRELLLNLVGRKVRVDFMKNEGRIPAIEISETDSSSYDTITEVGDDVFYVTHNSRTKSRQAYYSIDHVVRISLED